jgi:mlo protein
MGLLINFSDPTRFRLARQTSFVRRHSGISTAPGIKWIVSLLIYAIYVLCYSNLKTSYAEIKILTRPNYIQQDGSLLGWSVFILTLFIWQVAFFRQFTGSVTKVDYMTMRHGFINVSCRRHLDYSFEG